MIKDLKKPIVLLTLLMYFSVSNLVADEARMSPYMAKITNQENYAYIWTLGVKGVGDGQDKLVTVDVNPNSTSYGKIINSISVGSRNEAHQSVFTDDRQYLWASGLDTNKIFIFDMHSNLGKPLLHKTIEDFVEKAGGIVGPYTLYALPGRMLITGLSNNRDHSGSTAMVEYNNTGEYIVAHKMPTSKDLTGAVKTGQYANGFGYDVRVLPRKNILINSSFTGWNNYMMDLGKMLATPEAMQEFGNTVVIWNLHTRQPKKIFDVPGSPLEIRCAWSATHNYCFATTALASKL